MCEKEPKIKEEKKWWHEWWFESLAKEKEPKEVKEFREEQPEFYEKHKREFED